MGKNRRGKGGKVRKGEEMTSGKQDFWTKRGQENLKRGRGEL